MDGMSSGIFFPDPRHILVVPNIKTRHAILKYLKDNRHDLAEQIKLWERRKFIPKDVVQEVFARFEKERIHRPKPDKFGLPGGEIDQYELDFYPENTPSYTLPREIVEETGYNPVEIIDKGNGESERIALFEKIICLYSPNKKEESGKTYETHFFLINRVIGEMNKMGVDGETDAPQIVEIASLHPGNFYPKHALGVKYALRKLIREGKTEYQEIFDHFEKVFSMPLPGLSETRIPPDPKVDLSDDELWEQVMASTKKIEKK